MISWRKMNLLNYKRYFLKLLLLCLCNSSYGTEKQEDILSTLTTLHPDYLLFGVPNQFGLLDPRLSMNVQTRYALQLIFEPLIKINNKQELEPALAKSWHVANNGKTIIISLQENHRFSDGAIVTAQDVAQSIQRICTDGNDLISGFKGLEGCHSAKNHALQIKVIDKSHLQFNININPTLFLFQLTSPRAVITKLTAQGLIGSNYYMLDKYENNYLILKPNPYYWDNKEVKNAGLILYRLDEKEINTWLASKHLDGTIMYALSKIMRFNNQHYQLKEEPSFTTEILVFNNQRFPFNIKLVRQALVSDIYNSDQVYKCLYDVEKAYGVIPPGIGGSIANVAPKTMPVIRPEEIFNQVPQLKNNFYSVTIHRHSALQNTCEDNALISVAKKYHIHVHLKYHPDYATLWPLYLNHQLDGFIEFFDTRSREAYTVLQFFTADSSENYANTKDKKIGSLIENALVMPTSHQRFQGYQLANRYLLSEGIVAPYYYIGHSNILSQCLMGMTRDFYFNPYEGLAQLYRKPHCSI